MNVDCYGPDQFHDIPWPETKQADVVRRYMAPLVERGTAALITNVDTDIHIALVDGIVIPYTVGSRGLRNSYVCAPQSHYVEYAYDELDHIDSRVQYYLLLCLIPIFRWFCRLCQFNKVVMVNNWLLSTNLYPALEAQHIRALSDTLTQHYSGHAVVFRSIDLGLRQRLYDALRDHGARMVFSRRVHIVHRDDEKAWKRSNIKHDGRLFRKTPYTLVAGDELEPADFERIADLYKQLYIDKYSSLNPVFTADFLRHLWKEGLWEFAAYRHQGTLDAAVGTIHTGEVGTAPVIGYEFDRPTQAGLYRLAYLEMLRSSQRRGETMHCSAGVAKYKQLRGARSYLEYNGVFDSHLPWWRRAPWWLFQQITDRITVPTILRENL